MPWDWVDILSGDKVPFLLREGLGPGFGIFLVGERYVDGMMFGEAVEAYRDQRSMPRTLFISWAFPVEVAIVSKMDTNSSKVSQPVAAPGSCAPLTPFPFVDIHGEDVFIKALALDGIVVHMLSAAV